MQPTRRTSAYSESTGTSTAASIATGVPRDSSFTPDGSFPSVIPPTHPARTLVLCFDGTGDQFDADNSNVVEFFSMLKKDNRRQQMVYYQAGIGTYISPQVVTPFTTRLSKTLDEMVAWNLDSHVMDGYEFLMQNYEEGDKICIFGFSRGAYTARALAGMIHKVGLLPACNHQQIPFAYRMYTDTTSEGWDQSKAFKKAFSIHVRIDFIGVWDTVASVGIFPKRLPFTAGNTAIRVFRHAMSLDERRARFKANLFHRGGEGEGRMRTGMIAEELREKYKLYEEEPEEMGLGSGGMRKGSSQTHLATDDEMERRFSILDSEGTMEETDVLEVWFAGCHCDVGGGSVRNGTRHTLARISLRWMIRQCFLAGTGIQFQSDALREVGMDPRTMWPVMMKRPSAVYEVREPSVSAKFAKSDPKRTHKKFWGSNVHRPLDQALTIAERSLSYCQSSVFDGVPASPLSPISPVFKNAGDMSMTLTEEEEDFMDSLSPMYDQLSMRKIWWLLEVLPLRHRVQQPDDSWTWEHSMNLGQGRTVPHEGRHNEEFYVHRTVKIRMEETERLGEHTPYVYQAKSVLQPTWVD